MAVNKQRFFFILVLCILAVFLASCVLVIRPRFICQQGIREFKTGNYDQAAFFFERAEAAMPAIPGTTWLTAADRLCLYTHYGRTLYHTGIRDWQDNGLSPEIHDLFTRAKSYLEKAMALESGYYITAFWLARTAHALEKIHPWLFPGTPNPHDAHARYVQASALRPAGITVRQALARYLYEKDQPDQIPALVRNLMEIYPPIYSTLKKEPYFTLDLVPFMAQGLENAVRNRVRPRDALRTLSQLYQDQDNLTAAIDYFEKYLDHDPKAVTPGDFFHLGALCLLDGRYDSSHEAFVKSLAATDNPNAVFNRIYNLFKARKLFIQFLQFADLLQGTTLVISDLDLVLARCYLDMDQVFLAKKKLQKIIETNPTGPACFLLATIAKNEKDWDTMEVISQKATRLDPYNHSYHYLFAQALNYRKKYANAEMAITRAIRHYPGETPSYYNFRAWTRWHQKKYADAAQDWDKAAALNPNHPDFPRHAARAREKAGSDLDNYLKLKKK